MKEFLFEEKAHRYTLDGKPLTGVTTILGVVAKPALIQWAADEACKYIVKNLEIRHILNLKQYREVWGKDCPTSELPDLAVTRYGDYVACLADARLAHRKKKEDAAEKGSDMHKEVEIFVKLCIEHNNGIPTDTLNVNPDILPFVNWAAKEYIRFIAAEKRMYSESLWIAGTCDLVFEKDGKRYIGDIKTYKKIWDRLPLIQCAGYSIMWEEYMGDGKGNTADCYKIDGYCVINLPKERPFNEVEDVVWSYDRDGDRAGFMAALTLYRQLETFKTK